MGGLPEPSATGSATAFALAFGRDECPSLSTVATRSCSLSETASRRSRRWRNGAHPRSERCRCPLYLASVGSGSVSLQMAQRCVSSLGDVAVGSGPLAGVGQAQASLDVLSAHTLRSAGASSSALVAPSLTMVNNVAASRADSGRTAQPAQLATTAGASRIFKCCRASGRPGVWVSDDYAALLRVRAGGTLLLRSADSDALPVSALSSIRVPIAGIYRQLVGTTLPAFWCSLSSVFGRPDSDFPRPLSSSPTRRPFACSCVPCTSRPSAS